MLIFFSLLDNEKNKKKEEGGEGKVEDKKGKQKIVKSIENQYRL